MQLFASFLNINGTAWDVSSGKNHVAVGDIADSSSAEGPFERAAARWRTQWMAGHDVCIMVACVSHLRSHFLGPSTKIWQGRPAVLWQAGSQQVCAAQGDLSNPDSAPPVACDQHSSHDQQLHAVRTF